MRRARRRLPAYAVAGLALAIFAVELRLFRAHPEFGRSVLAGSSLGLVGLAGGVVLGAAFIVYRLVTRARR